MQESLEPLVSVRLRGVKLYGTFYFHTTSPPCKQIGVEQPKPQEVLGVRGGFTTLHISIFFDYSYEHLQPPPMYKPPEVSIIIYIIRGF